MKWILGFLLSIGLLAAVGCSQNTSHPKTRPPILEAASQVSSIQVNSLVDGLRMKEAIGLTKFMAEPMDTTGLSNSRLRELKSAIQSECFVRPTRKNASFGYDGFLENFKVYEHYEANDCPIYGKQDSVAYPVQNNPGGSVQRSTFRASFELLDPQHGSILFVRKANLSGTYSKKIKRKSHDTNVHTTEVSYRIRATDWDGSEMEYFQSETHRYTESLGTVLSENTKNVVIVKSPQGQVQLERTAQPINKSGELKETFNISGLDVQEKVYNQRFADAYEKLQDEAYSEDYPSEHNSTSEYP